MKLLCCVALLLAGYAQAGELLPVTGDEDEAESVQEYLDEFTLPAVQEIDASILVEPIIEMIKLSGRAKRIFLGPFAGDSYILLRVRIADGDTVRETLIKDEAGNWEGTFRPGEDSEMLERVAIRAAEFIQSYATILPRVERADSPASQLRPLRDPGTHQEVAGAPSLDIVEAYRE